MQESYEYQKSSFIISSNLAKYIGHEQRRHNAKIKAAIMNSFDYKNERLRNDNILSYGIENE